MCCSVSQCVAVCCNVLRCVAVCCSVCCHSCHARQSHLHPLALMCCSVLQCCSVAVCCSVAMCCSVLQCDAVSLVLGQTVASASSGSEVLQGVAVCCRVLQRAAVCSSVLQCVAVCSTGCVVCVITRGRPGSGICIQWECVAV